MNGDESPPELERLEAGRRLYGKNVRFRHWAPGTGILCTKLYANGDVELHGMPGMFHPSLFVIDDEDTKIPLEGKVD